MCHSGFRRNTSSKVSKLPPLWKRKQGEGKRHKATSAGRTFIAAQRQREVSNPINNRIPVQLPVIDDGNV
jgi:hypothetical protein